MERLLRTWEGNSIWLIIGLSFAFAFGMKYERDQWKAGKRRKEMERLLRTWKEIDI